MKKTKILSIIGTRPEAIKMAPLIHRLEENGHRFESRVCVTGQHREMLHQILDLMDIEPHHDLDVMKPNQSLTGVTTAVLAGLDPVLAAEDPDWVLVQGDTTTAMAASLAAFYHRVPVGHVEAGLRTASKHNPFPEEANRRIAGVLADLHFAPTRWAADNLVAEGVPADQVFVTGNTVIDSFRHVARLPFAPAESPLRDVPGDKRLIMVTAHRRENFGRPIEDLCRIVRGVVEDHPDVHVVWPVHPNPHVHQPINYFLGNVDGVSLLPPLDYRPMVWLLDRCHMLLTDSGGLQEEATGIGKPTLVLRDSTERPEGIKAGSAHLVGSNGALIEGWTRRLLTSSAAYDRMARATSPYGDGDAADRIVGVLAASHSEKVVVDRPRVIETAREMTEMSAAGFGERRSRVRGLGSGLRRAMTPAGRR